MKQIILAIMGIVLTACASSASGPSASPMDKLAASYDITTLDQFP